MGLPAKPGPLGHQIIVKVLYLSSFTITFHTEVVVSNRYRTRDSRSPRPLGPLWCQLGVSYARRSGVSYPIARVYARVVLLGADRRPLAYAHVRRDRCPTVAEAGEPRGERSTVVMGQSPSVPLPSPLPLSPIIYPPVSSAAAGSVEGVESAGVKDQRGHACSFRRVASLT